MQDKRISIVLVCDDFYAILLVAFLKSIEVNHKTDEIIEVYLVSDNISDKNKRRILSSLSLELMEINWINMQDAIPKGISLPFLNNAYPLNILIRLFIPYFVPEEKKKVIYFDVDMIMLNDISKLWNIDIGQSIIGATADTFANERNTIAQSIDNYRQLGLDGSKPYLNSGMLIFNTDLWRSEDLTKKTIDAIANNKKHAKLSDQYALNITLIDKWFEIDRLWNCFSSSNISKPNLIHYFYRKPIYKEYSNNYREEFFYYLNLTAWKNFTPIGKSGHYLKKVKNTLQKLKFIFKS